MSKKKRVLKVILGVVVALVVISVVGSIISKTGNKTVAYETLNPTTNDTVELNTILTGSIEPRDLVLIKPQMTGIVAELLKQPGEMVQAGELVARIAMVPDIATVQNAQARVETALIQLNQVREVYERDKSLYEQKVLATERFQESKAAFDRATIDYNSAKETLELVSKGSSASTKSSNNTLVRATVSGLILEQPVKVGQSVIQSNNFNEGTTIVSIADLKDLLFIGNVNESDVAKIKVGADVTIRIGAMPKKTFPATVEYVSPKGVQTSGSVMFEVKAALDKTDLEGIRAGFSSNAEIILDRKENVMTIPEKCVYYEGDKSFVYVSKGGSKEEDFEKKEVQLGISDGLKVEVLSGLTENEIIRGNKK